MNLITKIGSLLILSLCTLQQVSAQHKEFKTEVIKGANNQRIITTNPEDHVIIEGANNEVVIKGSCVSLMIKGANNQVTLLNCDQIIIKGSNNVIQSTLLQNVDISGANNEVNYKATINPKLKLRSKVDGANNIIERISR